jgi:hypothetical protein
MTRDPAPRVAGTRMSVTAGRYSGSIRSTTGTRTTIVTESKPETTDHAFEGERRSL